MKGYWPAMPTTVSSCHMEETKDRRDVVDVVIETPLGSIEIAVYAGQAPMSAQAFLLLVDDSSFTQHGTIYRAVRKIDNDHGSPRIDVVQGGWRHPSRSLEAIEHETTWQTGLRHLDGTVSLARGAVGTATGAAFFICIGDQSALDAGGGRSGDGQGFAAFGRVARGMETIRRIHELSTSTVASEPYLSGQILDPPLRILRAYRQPIADRHDRHQIESSHEYTNE